MVIIVYEQIFSSNNRINFSGLNYYELHRGELLLYFDTIILHDVRIIH